LATAFPIALIRPQFSAPSGGVKIIFNLNQINHLFLECLKADKSAVGKNSYMTPIKFQPLLNPFLGWL
jgi:hypothetical protein